MSDELEEFQGWWDTMIPNLKKDLEDAIKHGKKPQVMICYAAGEALAITGNLDSVDAYIAFATSVVVSTGGEPLGAINYDN